MKQDNFIFVATPLKVLCPLPIEIIPGYILQKATSEQVSQIKSFLSQLRYEVSWSVNQKIRDLGQVESGSAKSVKSLMANKLNV